MSERLGPPLHRHRLVLLPLVLTCIGALAWATGSNTISTMDNTASAPLALEVSLRVGHTVFAPGQARVEAITQALREANARDRLVAVPGQPTLPDALDIGLRDEAKVLAFLAGWSRLSADLRRALRGSTLQLDATALKLGTSSAVTPAVLQQGYSLSLPTPPSPGQPARVLLATTPDLSLARQRATQAHQALEALEPALAQAKATAATHRTADTLRAKAALQNQAASVAMVWRDMVADLLAAKPGDATLAAEAGRADKAVARHRINAPSQGGMPG